MRSEINGTNPTVARLQAELNNAKYELEPDNRSRSHRWLCDPGLPSSRNDGQSSAAQACASVFIDSQDQHAGGQRTIQNSLQRVRVGDREAGGGLQGRPRQDLSRHGFRKSST